MRIRERYIRIGSLISGVLFTGAIIAVIFFAIGANYGARKALDTVKQTEAKRAGGQACVCAWQKTIQFSENHSALKNERWAREGAERENRVMMFALQKLFQGVNFQPSLAIQWNRPRLRPMSGVLLYNADAMPDHFTDRNGFIQSHHAKRGEKAVYLGECSNGVTVFALSGTFAGKVLTFKPWERYDRQGVLVYHF